MTDAYKMSKTNTKRNYRHPHIHYQKKLSNYERAVLGKHSSGYSSNHYTVIKTDKMVFDEDKKKWINPITNKERQDMLVDWTKQP